MAKFSFASSFLLYLLHILSELHHHQSFANKCDEDFFYLPYVSVKKKKNGGDIASIRSSGFLDLRFRSRVVLCINGPVVMYSDVERLVPDDKLNSQAEKGKDSPKEASKGNASPKEAIKGKDPVNATDDSKVRIPTNGHANTDMDTGDEELRFKKGELLVFNHHCMSINKVPTHVLKKMKEDQRRPNPEIMPDTQVNGKMVLGIFLIGNKEGHNHPELAWFKGANYDYIKSKDKTVKDSSFIITSANVTHCLRLPDGAHIKIGVFNRPPANSSSEVCRWTVQEADKPWYSKVFQRGYDGNGVLNGEPYKESDYEFYDCPDTDPDRTIILTMAKALEPISHANFTEFDPFSLFNPNMWSPHGSRKDTHGLSGGDERSEDKAMSGDVTPEDNTVPCSLDPSNPTCLDTDDMEATTLKDMQNVDPSSINSYEIAVGDCIELPVFNMDDCTGVGDNGNRLLELVLELDPKFVPANPASDNATESEMQEFPKYRSLQDNKTLEWKHDLLYLASDIFADLCMPFRPEMPYTVARVFGWYVYKAHLYGVDMGRVGPPPGPPAGTDPALDSQFEKEAEKNDPWPILLKELERCRDVAKTENGGKGLKFQWEIGDDSGKWKIPAVDGRETKRRKKRSVIQRRPVQKAYEPKKRSNQKRSIYHSEDHHQKHGELVEEIDAETGAKVLSRQKRAGTYKINGSVITTKFVLPGKTLTAVKSEGTWGYAREAIQEYRKKPDLNDPRVDAMKYMDYPQNIQHCWNPQEDQTSKQIVCSKTEDIFFYEDKSEIEYELNIAIDLWWKIWATVIGYCNKAYHSRKSETFPRLYNAKFEYFFDLVQKEWKFPEDNAELKILFSEYLTEESQVWMDACLEAAYINSNSQSYRPPRPMSIMDEGGKEVPNYFEEIPSYLYYRYHPEP